MLTEQSLNMAEPLLVTVECSISSLDHLERVLHFVVELLQSGRSLTLAVEFDGSGSTVEIRSFNNFNYNFLAAIVPAALAADFEITVVIELAL